VAVPNGIKVPVPFEYVFPAGVMFMGVEPVTDFDAKSSGVADNQARDKETGDRLWQITVIDNDEEASKFGRSPAVKVKIPAKYQPVPPSPQVPGFRPLVAFEGLTLTPYVDQQKCRGLSKGPHKCGGRLAYSLRATAMVDPATVPSTPATEPTS
jgi:hypothetical protein